MPTSPPGKGLDAAFDRRPLAVSTTKGDSIFKGDRERRRAILLPDGCYHEPESLCPRQEGSRKRENDGGRDAGEVWGGHEGTPWPWERAPGDVEGKQKV